jgi:hypothetical protein
MLLAGLLVLVLLGGWLGDRWLESAGGQRLLERELSQAIGSPARLTGDYRFRLVPRIVIAGSGLAVGATAGEAPVTVESFRAAVGLLPLLRQTLRIDSIELSGGRVDLAGAARLIDASDGTQAAPLRLPAVAALELRDFRLSLPDPAIQIRLGRLELHGFRPGQRAPVAIEAELVRQGAVALAALLEGSLQVTVNPLTAELNAERLSWRTGSSRPLEMSGVVRWQADGQPLSAELSYNAAGRAFSAHLEVAFAGAIAGRLDLRVVDQGAEQSARAELTFKQHDGVVELAPVKLEIAGQEMAGRGCLIVAANPTLHLMLHAAELDLDRLAALLPAAPADTPAELELPLGLAIEATAERAIYAGTTAHGIRVLVGAEPDCPLP